MKKHTFSLKDKINVLIFALQQLGWALLTPDRQRPILFEMLERLHIMLVGSEEQVAEEKWKRSETTPGEYHITIISKFKLIDVDSGEEFTDEPVRGYGSSKFTNSEEDTMIAARLKASSRAELQFMTNLLQNK